MADNTATAQAVAQSLHTLLRTVDFGKTTERMIREMLAKELGDVSPHVDLIRSEIEAYLANMGSMSSGAAAPQQRGTKRPAAQAADAPAPKFAKNDDKYRLALGSNKYLTVSSFKGKTYVGIREFYEKGGELHPGGKGTNMEPQLWGAFTTAIPALEQALQQQDTDYALNLSDTRRVTVVKSGGAVAVDVREWYKKQDGEAAPTKKGVRFDVEALQLISSHLADIEQAAQSGGAGATSSSKPAAASSKQQAGGSSQPAASTSSAAAQQGPGEGQGQEVMVELGGRKRMSVREFKGRTYVDLREFYEKDGEMLPGKKGIMLGPAEWEKLVGSLEELQQALAAKNTAFFVDLTNKRRASISEFRNSLYVNVREYYEKAGEMLPGAKGLSMSQDQWAVALANVAKIIAAVQATTKQ